MTKNFTLNIPILAAVSTIYASLPRGKMPHHIDKQFKADAFAKLLDLANRSQAVIEGDAVMKVTNLTRLCYSIIDSLGKLPEDANVLGAGCNVVEFVKTNFPISAAILLMLKNKETSLSSTSFGIRQLPNEEAMNVGHS